MDYNQNEQENQHKDWENAQENWNRWQEEQEKKDWDKWDSNASHSSYYNQPTHTPYDQGFSLASMVCGILSVTLGCCGLSIPLSALGILFAVLCYRKNKPLNPNCRAGIFLSLFGLLYGVITLVYFLTHQITSLQYPAYLNQISCILP